MRLSRYFTVREQLVAYLRFLAFASFFCVTGAASAGQLSPSTVLSVANAHGEQAALAEFFSCDKQGEAAYARVSSGSPQWVAVAVRLLPAADACYSESLHDSLARALVHSPATVLPLVNSAAYLSSQAICVPFLSAEEPTSRSVAYLRREIAVLQAVQAPELQAGKQACLGEVRHYLAAIKR